MPNYWILKTEPSSYSYDQLERERSTMWDGVRNNVALKHIRQMRPGDRAFIYHSGKEKAVIGEARITSKPYPDPSGDNPRFVVVDLEAGKRLETPVELKTIKADSVLKDLPLVRMSRLSVSPATKRQWERIRALGNA